MIVIYHHNDLDGRSAASLIYNMYKDQPFAKFKFIEVDYNTRDLNADDVEDCAKVFILDYSLSEKGNLMEFCRILDKAESVFWIDHHKTSIELQKSDPETYHQIKGIRLDGYSGALLTWYWLQYKTENSEYDETLDISDIEKRLPHCPRWIRLIDDWDTFKCRLASREFKLGVEIYDTSPTSDIWYNLLTQIYSENQFIDKGDLIVRYENQVNSKFVHEFGFESEINGVKCFVLNKRGSSTMFMDKYKEYPFVCTCTFNGKRWSYSLYSDGNYDVSSIAKSFPGGGGHKGAAGFTTDEFLFQNVSLNTLK